MTQRDGQTVKLGPGKWAYRYRDPATGKRPQRSGFKTKGEARDALDIVLERMRLGGAYREHTNMREIRDQFFRTHVVDPVTLNWMKYHAAKIVATFGDQHPDEIQPMDIAEWRLGLSNKASANQTHRIFRQLCAAAVKWGWTRKNPAAAVKNTVPQHGEAEAFPDWPTVEAIARELGEGPSGAAILITGVGTGARPEELFGLDWPDVNLKAKTITFRRVFTKGRLKDEMKTRSSLRTVPLRARVVDVLAALPDRRGPVFHGPKGARVHLNTWRARDWQPAFEAADVDYLVPYAWRHTYATWSLAAGINIFTLAKRMGTSVQMIDKRYGHHAKGADDYERSLLDAWDIAGGADALGREMDVFGVESDG